MQNWNRVAFEKRLAARLSPVPGRAAGIKTEKPAYGRRRHPPKLGTAYDIGPRQAIRDCNRVGLAKVAGAPQTGYDRTGNES